MAWGQATEPDQAARIAELERQLAATNARLARLRAAVWDPGSNPAYHRQVMRKARKAWPVLWDAIDQLVGRP